MRIPGASLSLITAMLMAMSSIPSVAAPEAETPHVIGGGEIQAEGQRGVVVINAAKGDYIEGNLSVTVGSFDLDVIGSDGAHIRRLITAATGETAFRFVSGGGGEQLAVTSGSGKGKWQLSIVQQLAIEQQRPPEVVYESPSIAALAGDIARGGGTDAFWQKIDTQGTPLVEPSGDGKVIMTFLARGAQRNVRLFGGPSGDHENLLRLGNSDVWYRSFIVPDSTRLSYQLAYDVPDIPGNARQRRVAILATAKADPFNRHPWPEVAPDAFNQESVVELANAPPQPWVREKGNPKGTLRSFPVTAAQLGNTRDITIYTPPGWDRSRDDTVLLFVFDAKEYLSKVPVPLILDNMIAAGAVPPVVAVFVANPDRNARARELPGNDAFADFMAGELLPRVISETGMKAVASRTVLAGSSYGGLASATVALRHPQAFGNVLSLSGSFWWHPQASAPTRPEYVASLVSSLKRRENLRFFLSAGLFEVGSGGIAGILDTTRHLRDVLEAKGYPVIYRDYAAGHDYFAWRGALADGMIALFGK